MEVFKMAPGVFLILGMGTGINVALIIAFLWYIKLVKQDKI